MNLARCKELGIDDKVDCIVGNLNEPLPEDWTGKFDFVWSCEVFCHAGDKVQVLSEIKRILKPGGIFVMSDIMGSDGASEKALKDFTDRNATTAMARHCVASQPRLRRTRCSGRAGDVTLWVVISTSSVRVLIG